MYKFEVINEAEYASFWENHPQQCFLSSPKIRHLTPNAKIYFLGVRKNNKLVAAAMIRGAKRKFGFYDYFAPYGALMNYHDKNLLEFFTKNIKTFLKSHHGYIFRMNPNIELVERDINGNVRGGV